MEHIVTGSSSLSGTKVYLSCALCNKSIRNFNRAQSWVHSVFEGVRCIAHEGEQVRPTMHSLGHVVFVEKEQPEATMEKEKIVHRGSGQRRGSKTDSGELMNRVNELENQVRLAQNKNLELKRALTRLYSLAQATHSEVKIHNSKLDERVKVISAYFPSDFRLNAHLEAMNNNNIKIGKKLENFESEMVNSGLHTGNSSAKERSVENIEDICH